MKFKAMISAIRKWIQIAFYDAMARNPGSVDAWESNHPDECFTCAIHSTKIAKGLMPVGSKPPSHDCIVKVKVA